MLKRDLAGSEGTRAFSSQMKNEIVYILLASANALFVWKYAGRYGFAAAAIIYFVVFVGATKYLSTSNELTRKFFSRKNFVALLILETILAAVVVCFLPEHTRVARLPAITEWLHRLTHGEFPYSGPTNPSGFPVLFAIALPFYLVGNVGLLEVVGIALFGVVILKGGDHTIQSSWRSLLLLALLPIVYYEIITRSELFFNMSLALVLIVTAEKFLDARRIGSKFILIAVAFGFVLSTRLIVAPLYVIFVVYKFKENLANGFIFSLIAILVFALTLVPFLVWNSTEFIQEGPFKMQFAYLPGWGVIAAFLASLFFGVMSKGIRDVSAFAGITIFFSVALAFSWAVYQIGIIQVISKDGFDIGYFILSVPFLLYGINFRETQSYVPSFN